MLIAAAEHAEEMRDEFTHRYAADYDLQLATTLSESMTMAQGLNARGIPVELNEAYGMSTVELVLTASVDGAEVRKIYRFERDRYLAEIRHEVTNTGAAALNLSPYARFQRTAFATGGAHAHEGHALLARPGRQGRLGAHLVAHF